MLFDWLVTGQVVPFNPASSVRGPKHVVKRGKTPVLSAEVARKLLNSIKWFQRCGIRAGPALSTGAGLGSFHARAGPPSGGREGHRGRLSAACGAAGASRP
jgi:hypothetical protein